MFGIRARLVEFLRAVRASVEPQKAPYHWKHCACCGIQRSKADYRTTRVDGVDHEARLFGNHGPMYDLICRSCRSCGMVYAFGRLQDEQLPEAPK